MMPHEADGRKLLIAVDDSEVCERAVKWALENLYRKGDQMHLVHIIPRMQLAAVYGAPPVDFLPQQDPVAYEQLVAEAERFVAARFLTLLQGLQPEPVAHIIKSEVDTDSIGNVLCKKAQDLQAVAIVMASHSKSSLQQFFLGRWQDGQRFERQLVDEFDRWQVHCADEVTVSADDISVVITQQVVITDQPSVLPLLHENIARNLPSIRTGGGRIDVRELVWGTHEGLRVASALSRPALDFVMAADCVYEGADIEAFIATCRLLCSSSTRCLVAIEQRTAAVYDRYMSQCEAAFSEAENMVDWLLPEGRRTIPKQHIVQD